MPRLWTLVLVALIVPLTAVGPAAATIGPPAVVAANVFPITVNATNPIGDLTITEAAVGQLAVGDVVTVRFTDSANAATLHFSAVTVISGTNGLAATAVVASSNATGAPLLDEMKVTVTQSSSGSFPGSLTLAGLSPTVDATAASGNIKATVSDTGALSSPVTVSDGIVVPGGATNSLFAPQSSPPIVATGQGQAIGNATITEPVKSFFGAGDVITFSLRDAGGSANTVGLASAPYAAGGGMTVALVGSNGTAVQSNDTSFKVDILAGDPSQGSASTLTISNLTVNTAQAPLGPVTLTAVVTTPTSNTEYILPGRITLGNVGGATTTTASGAPRLSLNTVNQFGGNVMIAATAGSLASGNTFSLHLQTAGVTFAASAAPIATITDGNLILQNAAATVDALRTTATWTVAIGNVSSSNIVIGPILYDVGSTAVAGQAVSLVVSGNASSAFTSATVTNAWIAAPTAVGVFSTSLAAVPNDTTAPWAGAPISFTENSTGAAAAGTALVLIAPYATQIAAYRTTFATVPTALGTNGIVLGPVKVNAAAMIVQTANGSITAPAQTVAIIPVVTASTSGPSTVTFSNLSWQPGSLVPPGVLLAAGELSANASPAGSGTSLTSNAVADAVSTLGLGTSSGTTAPEVTLTASPPAVSNSTSATFAFTANQASVTFSCFLDGILISIACPSPLTLPGLSQGTHIFSVAATNLGGYSSVPVNFSWTIDSIPPTALVTLPLTLSAPLLVTFSKPVGNVTTSTTALTLTDTAAPVAATVTCTDASSLATSCVTGLVVHEAITPTLPWIAGQHYSLTLNPVAVTPAITDVATNVLATATTMFRGPLTQQENAPGVSASWSTVKSSTALGGSYVVESQAGAAVVFNFTGTTVTWNTRTGPDQGRAALFIDGVLRQSINNYALTLHAHVARTVTGLTNAPHTLRLVVSGIKGATAATNDLVAVDAFTVGTTITQQDNASLAYSWGVVAVSGASGGHVARSALAGARYNVSFRGTGIRWYALTGPTYGWATVYVDGVLVATVDLYGKTAKVTGGRTISGLTDALHTLTIVVLGRHDTASTSSAVTVDQMVVT